MKTQLHIPLLIFLLGILFPREIESFVKQLFKTKRNLEKILSLRQEMSLNNSTASEQSETEDFKSDLGFKCVGECVESSSGKYHWCHAADVGWDYCTPPHMKNADGEKRIFGIQNKTLTSRGYKCTTPCDQTKGTSYFWCSTVDPFVRSTVGDIVSPKHNWDYCSPTPGLDYRGSPCEDHCGFRGQSYMWCHVHNSSSWGYCS